MGHSGGYSDQGRNSLNQLNQLNRLKMAENRQKALKFWGFLTIQGDLNQFLPFNQLGFLKNYAPGLKRPIFIIFSHVGRDIFVKSPCTFSRAHKRQYNEENCSGGMSCNNAQVITQNFSEVVTHYTAYYTAKNWKKCPNYTKKIQGSRLIFWRFGAQMIDSWKISENKLFFGEFSTHEKRKILACAAWFSGIFQVFEAFFWFLWF